jgi:hypothetical protein
MCLRSVYILIDTGLWYFEALYMWLLYITFFLWIQIFFLFIFILLSGDSLVSANSCPNSRMGSYIWATIYIFPYVTNIMDKIGASAILMCDQKQFFTGEVQFTWICNCCDIRYCFQHFTSGWWRDWGKAGFWNFCTDLFISSFANLYPLVLKLKHADGQTSRQVMCMLLHC